MSKVFVKLADHALFKSRYNKWYLIDTSRRERERVLIEGGAEQVLLFLFKGNTTQEACARYGLKQKDLEEFLHDFQNEDVLTLSNMPAISIAKCHNIEPPLDCINVLLTNSCDLRCAHCYVSSGKPMADELDGHIWIRVLKEARQLGVFELNITGGEATLHRDFVKVAEYIASVSTFNTNLNTNGLSLPLEYEEVIKSAFTSVQVSIDDAVAEKHDAFRGRQGSFKRSIKTIERLVARGVETNISFTLTRENIDALDGVVELAEQLGVTTLNIGLVANIGRANVNALAPLIDYFSPHDDLFMEQMYQKMKVLSVRSSRVRLLLPFRVPTVNTSREAKEKRFICDGDNTQIIFIMANGNIMPCDKLPVKLFSYGNVKQHSLIDVWTSQRMQAFKLMSPQSLPKCRNCSYFKICGGACVARAYQMGGSLEFPDWTSCIIAQKFFSDKAAHR